MRDGSDAVSDWRLLDALLNCASRATWVSLHGARRRRHRLLEARGMAVCCDGTREAAKRVGACCWNDPANRVMRHADAGYDGRRLRPRQRAGLPAF